MKEKVIFIGSFLSQTKSGGLGGQMFACKSLIESELSDDINWLKIDSTAETNLHRSFIKRASNAFHRLFLLVQLLLKNKEVRKVLIFTSNGMSFIEKGIMALISASIFRKKVILAPRSGRIVNDLENKKRQWFIKKVFSNCEYVICQGEYWKELFESTFLDINSSKYVVIENWIKADALGKNETNLERIKGQILFLGWLEKDKGIYDLLEAAKKLKSSNISFKLIIGGKGVEEERLSQEIISCDLSNYVITPGWIKGEKKQKLLMSSEIFVLPSYFEGMPNALLEAMSLRIPCIATRTGAIPNLIEDGHDGLLVEVGNVQKLYESILKLLNDVDLRNKLGQNAKESISLNHSINNAIPKFNKILLDETNNSRP